MNAYIVCVIFVFIQTYDTRTIEDYHKLRNRILQEELDQSVGARIELSEDEQLVNDILMKWKNKELEDSFSDPTKFSFSDNYLTYRDKIKDSKVYQIIKKMPKGAFLHVHSTYMTDANDLLELTYEDHLYACYDGLQLQLKFSLRVPEEDCSVEWKLLSDMRDNATDIAEFDKGIKQFFTYNPAVPDAGINEVWRNFEGIFGAASGLLKYRPTREKHIYRSLQKLYEDNILYVEIRTGLGNLFELDGTKHNQLYLAKLYKKVVEKFKEDHPNFVGVKLILTMNRKTTSEDLQDYIEVSKACQAEMPEMCAGFDLVGQEDLGRPLVEFEKELNKAKDLGYYFHGGETNWFGTSTDENLLDAILLGTKRIGHGYALIKHPALMQLVKQRDIAIEINVISNNVLALVKDVRNHPLATYLAMGLPVVLSSDDPGAWNSDPLSHDFYVAFVGVASKKHDLRLLKQLALNSIRYSAMSDSEKIKSYRIFLSQWRKFIEDVIAGNIV